MYNVWLINYYSYPPGKSNWRRHFDLGKEIVKRGFNLDIIGSSFIHDRKEQILEKSEESRIERHSGVNYHILKSISYNTTIKRVFSMVEFMFRVIFYQKKIKNKPDIIYCSCPHPFNGLAALYLSKKYKIPLILEIRDLWPETWVEMGAITKKSIIYKIFFKIEKILYKNSSKIITLMPDAYKYIEGLGITREKVEYLSNGIDLAEFDTFSNKETKKEELKKGNFNITYTGAHGVANCLDTILDVAEELKEYTDIKFHLIGEGPEKEKLRRISKEKGLSNIEFYNPVSKNKIPNILKNSDALIVIAKRSSLYKYGISFNKIFEYMASGKPIVFSGNVSNDMIKISNAGISVDAEDKEQVKKAILSIYNLDLEKRLELGKNGRIYVEEFSNIKLGEKLYNIIREEIKC